MSAVRILFLGDLVGDVAVDYVVDNIGAMRAHYGAHFCVVNGENMHQGRGVNEVMCKRLFKAGVDVLTGGDHSFDKHLIIPYMLKERHLLRPMNYPKGVAGLGFGVFDLPNSHHRIGVLNLRGNVFFNNPIQCPFRTADWAVSEIARETNLIFVDMHAEATAEKVALAHYLDGRVSVVAGTHTHVQTADDRILPQGTGFISDVGCVGAYESVIGMSIDTAIQRFLLQTPQRGALGDGPLQACGLLVDLDPESGQCVAMERISVLQGEEEFEATEMLH